MPPFNFFAGTNVGANTGVTPKAPVPTTPTPQGLTPMAQQRLRGLGAVQAGLSPSIDAYVAKNAPTLATNGIKASVPGSSTTSNTLPKPNVAPLGGQYAGGPPPNTYQPDSLIAGLGAAKTPEQIAASTGQTQTGGSTTGTTGSTTGGTTTGTTSTSAGGIIGDLLNTTKTNVGEMQGASSALSSLQKQIDDYMSAITQQGDISTYGHGLTSDQVTNRVQQLEGIKNAALSAIQSEQAAISGQQTQAQGAAGTALGALTTTAQAPYGTPLYQPATGQFINSGTQGTGGTGTTGGTSNITGDPNQDSQNFATAVMNRQMTYEQAISAMGYAGSIGTTALNNAILKLGGNPLQLQSQGAGEQSVLGGIPNLESANTAAKGIAQTITSYLQQNPTLNSSLLAAGNAVQQWIQGKQLADPRYQTLINYLNEFTNTLAPILGVGGDPTNLKTEIAQGFINAQASGQSITQVLQGISQLADQKVKNIQSGATGGGVVAGSPVSSSSGGSTGTGTFSDSSFFGSGQ